LDHQQLRTARGKPAALEISGRTFVLPQACDMAAAIDLHGQLSGVVGEDDIVVGAADVAKCWSPMVQVLVSAGRAQASRGRSFLLRHPSPALRETFGDLGLAAHLSRWEQVNG